MLDYLAEPEIFKKIALPRFAHTALHMNATHGQAHKDPCMNGTCWPSPEARAAHRQF
jgi:hypothetical protein